MTFYSKSRSVCNYPSIPDMGVFEYWDKCRCMSESWFLSFQTRPFEKWSFRISLFQWATMPCITNFHVLDLVEHPKLLCDSANVLNTYWYACNMYQKIEKYIFQKSKTYLCSLFVSIILRCAKSYCIKEVEWSFLNST